MPLTISEYDENVTGETERLITSGQLSIKSTNSILPVSDVTGTAVAGAVWFGSFAVAGGLRTSKNSHLWILIQC